jgi:hypothetical protein
MVLLNGTSKKINPVNQLLMSNIRKVTVRVKARDRVWCHVVSFVNVIVTVMASVIVSVLVIAIVSTIVIVISYRE